MVSTLGAFGALFAAALIFLTGNGLLNTLLSSRMAIGTTAGEGTEFVVDARSGWKLRTFRRQTVFSWRSLTRQFPCDAK
jgi:hypothetical protein